MDTEPARFWPRLQGLERLARSGMAAQAGTRTPSRGGVHGHPESSQLRGTLSDYCSDIFGARMTRMYPLCSPFDSSYAVIGGGKCNIRIHRTFEAIWLSFTVVS